MSTAGPAHRVQSATVEYGYPKGHLGHLTPEEEEALRKFRALCIEKGVYRPEERNEDWGVRDDATLLRFLRARRFNIDDAYAQLKDTEDWRDSNQLDLLYETIDMEQYEETRRLYPQWTGRRDRRGIPVYVYEVKHLHSKTMHAYEKSAVKTHSKAQTDGKTPPKLLRLFALYENLIRFVMPLCTSMTDRDHPRTPITQSNNIVDISGVSLMQFWNLRSHMQDASTLATAHYPETLDRIFIIGAPSFFPTVWGWIKRWFDPITTSKIFILSKHDMQKTLEQFVEPRNIPKVYGGELDFQFGDLPILDPAVKDTIQWHEGYTDFPHGPMYWKDRGDYIEAIAMGAVDGKERDLKICTVKKNMDPYGIKVKMIGEESNGKITEPGEAALPADLSKVPTEVDVVNQAASEGESKDVADAVVQDGELVPASRPEPQSFVTASEELNKLSIHENGKTVPESEEPAKAAV